LEVAPALTFGALAPVRAAGVWLFGQLTPEPIMTDHKKKGDFDQARKGGVGGNKKAHAKGESSSRTGSKQNAGHGGRR
jgi:hypothetical protein